jgi:hypothetical protein
VTRFEVVLERRLNGAASGSTHDTIDAATPDEGEQKDIAAWAQIEPRFTYRPLLTTQVQPCRGCGRSFPWTCEADFCPECAAANAG